MPRLTRSLFAALAVVVAAGCAPGGDDVAADTPASPATTLTIESGADTTDATPDATSTTSSGAPTTTGTVPEEDPAPDPDRPPAPDVSLDLADGSTFVLSEQDQPVFLVFWAEW